MKTLLGQNTITELQGRDISLELEETRFSKLKVAFQGQDSLKRMRQERYQVKKRAKSTDAPIPALKAKLPVGFVLTYNVDLEQLRLDVDVGEFKDDGVRIY